MKLFPYLLCIVACLASHANAQTLGHTDAATFSAEIPGDAIVSALDFDSLSAGGTILNGDAIDGYQFNFDFDGVNLRVDDAFSTSTPNNYLGTTDAGLLQDGDNFVIDVAASNSFGLQIVSADPLMDGDVSLTFNGTTVDLVGIDIQQTLADDSFVYFLGVTSSDFMDTTAIISTLGDGVFLYNVDDIISAIYPASVLLGDVNLDGVVNLLDIEPFVDLISTSGFQPEADINMDGVVNLLDIEFFVGLLAG